MSGGNGEWELTRTPGPSSTLEQNGGRFELKFNTVESEMFEIDQQGWFDTDWLFHPYNELMGYEMPITKILEDNSM